MKFKLLYIFMHVSTKTFYLFVLCIFYYCLTFAWKLTYLGWFGLMFFFSFLLNLFGWHIICTMYCVFITLSNLLHITVYVPFTLFHFPPPLTLITTTLFSVSMSCFLSIFSFLLNPSIPYTTQRTGVFWKYEFSYSRELTDAKNMIYINI